MGVRWDSVVRGSRFWDSPAREPAAGLPSATGPVSVTVELFGALAGAAGTPRATVEVPPAGTVATAVALLADRLGPDFGSLVLDADGTLHRHCRAFVDGVSVADPGAAVRASDGAARIELILLTAAEGG